MEVIFLANSSNNDIQRALREALTSGLGDFLRQEPASSESTGRRRSNNRSSNKRSGNSQSQGRRSGNSQSQSGRSGNRRSNSTGNSNRRNRSRGSRTGARSSRGNSRLLELFRQRLASRLGGDNQRRSGRSRSRRSRRS